MLFIKVPDQNDSVSALSIDGKEYRIRFTYNETYDYWSFGLSIFPFFIPTRTWTFQMGSSGACPIRRAWGGMPLTSVRRSLSIYRTKNWRVDHGVRKFS